ncbi:carbonic anhydrase [Ketogulonicigenium robustum]|uniref:carbonic anhydrase n=1 Tax=Ketogulonicigenium robustum TaxID=92947 RepID=A0A1W6P227_9RHOB|nr:carbonic anhydrase family protein [Ketogulonicigenium robustum]ARO15451.1 carbonic anhydrase [Ketogulonicigenium robustum]
MKIHRAITATLLASVALSAHAEGAHWGYTGEGSPDHWAELSPEYEACGSGSTQSPIDINDQTAIPAVLPALAFGYTPFPLELVNNGHSVQVSGAADNGFAVDDHSFELVQFHFHAPSEYQLNGVTYPLELHLVHKREDGALAVIGIMFEEGAENPALANVFAHIPSQIGTPEAFSDALVNVNELLPEDQLYYRLMGSLTTPPCSEGVNWYVMEHPLTASAAQIEAFAHLFPEGDARPLQASNNRLVVKGVH